MSNYKNVVLADSPANYWILNETSGNAADIGSSPLTATASGTVKYSQSGIPGANGDTAVSLYQGTGTGTGHFETSTAYPAFGAAYTIEAWVFTTNLTQRDNGIAARWSVAGGALIWFDFASGNSHVQAVHTGTSSNYLDTGVSLVSGRWNHVVQVWDGATLAMYINSTRYSKSMATVPGGDSSFGFSIGEYGGDITTRFDGLIDEVAVYTTALSTARVDAHYIAGITSARLGNRLRPHPFSPGLAR